MNSLHTIIEQIDTPAMAMVDSFAPGMDTKFARLFHQHAREAICFDMGHMDNMRGMSAKVELLRLPYPVCWFEGTGTDNDGDVRIGTLCWMEEDQGMNKMIALPFMRRPHVAQGAWVMRGLWAATFNDDNTTVFEGFPHDERVLKINRELAQWVWVFMSALNCVNVKRVETLPPPKLQKARARRGKVPLFSTWTLQLDLENRLVSREDLGGTHASPRLHLRRGHPRQHSPGKWCWVQPHVVGSAHGIVHKDYAAL